MSDAITDHTVDVVWLTPLTGLEMQKVCDIGSKFNLCHHLHLHAGTKGCFELQEQAVYSQRSRSSGLSTRP